MQELMQGGDLPPQAGSYTASYTMQELDQGPWRPPSSSWFTTASCAMPKVGHGRTQAGDLRFLLKLALVCHAVFLTTQNWKRIIVLLSTIKFINMI